MQQLSRKQSLISGLTKVDQQLLSPRLTYQPTTLSFEEAVQIMYVLGLLYGVCHCKLAGSSRTN